MHSLKIVQSCGRDVRKSGKRIVCDAHQDSSRGLGRGGRVGHRLLGELGVKVSEVEVVPHVGVKRRLQFLLVEKVPVDGAEERVSHDDVVVPLLRAQSLRLVLLQQTFQKVPSGRGYMWAESEGLVENVVVHFGDVAAVEGRESVHHLVGDHAQTPPVHRSTVVLFLEHLGGEVLRGTTECGCRVT